MCNSIGDGQQLRVTKGTAQLPRGYCLRAACRTPYESADLAWCAQGVPYVLSLHTLQRVLTLFLPLLGAPICYRNTGAPSGEYSRQPGKRSIRGDSQVGLRFASQFANDNFLTQLTETAEVVAGEYLIGVSTPRLGVTGRRFKDR